MNVRFELNVKAEQISVSKFLHFDSRFVKRKQGGYEREREREKLQCHFVPSTVKPPYRVRPPPLEESRKLS